MDRYVGWDGIHWLSNGRQWVQPVYYVQTYLQHGRDDDTLLNIEAKHLLVRDVRTPKMQTLVSIAPSCRFLFGNQDGLEFDTVFLSPTHLIQEQFPVSVFAPKVKDVLDVYDADWTYKTTLRHWAISIPRFWTVKQVQLSPQGDHLAWVVGIHPDAWMAWLQERFLQQAKWKSVNMTAIYVSDIEGKHFEAIGEVPTPTRANTDVELKWLPGGKRLSFMYQDNLYVCDAAVERVAPR